MFKSNLSSVTIVIATLSVGILIGRSFPSAKPVADNEIVQPSELRNHLGQVSHEDFEDYLQLKNQKEKYEKADEILAKMMLIFLTDLGLQNSKDKMAVAKQLLDGVKRTEPLVSATPLQPPLPVPSTPMTSAVAVNPTPNRQGQAAAVGSHSSNAILQQGEQALNQIASEEQAKDFLKSVTLDNLFPSLAEAQALKPNQLQTLNGRFTGKVIFDEKAGKSDVEWDVHIDFESSGVGDNAVGSTEVQLFKSGQSQAFSHTRGRGNLKGFQSFAGGSDAILISIVASGNDNYFQLYAPKNLGYLVGNYYAKTGPGVFQKTGTVSLQKQ